MICSNMYVWWFLLFVNCINCYVISRWYVLILSVAQISPMERVNKCKHVTEDLEGWSWEAVAKCKLKVWTNKNFIRMHLFERCHPVLATRSCLSAVCNICATHCVYKPSSTGNRYFHCTLIFCATWFGIVTFFYWIQRFYSQVNTVCETAFPNLMAYLVSLPSPHCLSYSHYGYFPFNTVSESLL
jgi:hypothetical protein